MKRQPRQQPQSLLILLLQLDFASRCAGQLLQAHGPEEEAEIRLCNASANITVNCVTPNHGLLTALVATLSCLLLLMICSMALPLAAQNWLLRQLACSSCRGKPRPGQNFSYINIGLYKTRNAVCRPEVYQQHVWGNGGGQGSGKQQLQQQQQPEEQPMVPVSRQDGLRGAELSPAVSAVCSVPICIEPVREEAGPVAAAAARRADSKDLVAGNLGLCWPELQCQHPALVCDALFCYRSDPNIRQTAAAAHSHWPMPSDETQRLLHLQQQQHQHQQQQQQQQQQQ